ncbi:hypothetical protein [Bacillus paranthracis]|uniref:hypothetical protein n=1 Tax=Bacillus paranthracis TaxID=2026186 RepID=UPI000A9A8C86|nr:hypothetical protein [Bacillus paranthracis]
MYTESELKHYDVPRFVDYICVHDESIEFDVDWWTVTELKELFNIRLTDQEKKTKIVAFKTTEGFRGYAAVYSKKEILDFRLINNA